MSLVQFEKIGANIGKIILNDPDHLNAMGEDMASEFAELCSKLPAEYPNLRAIILTGAGRAFSAGGNLEMLEKKRELSAEKNHELMLRFYNSFLGILSLNIPLVAAINGHAIGAGLCVACACDVRIAAEKAKLGFTFTRLGLHPGMGATWFLPKVLGWSRAAELMLTGRVISADEALRIGLVSQVVSEQEILKCAQDVAEEIASCGPDSVKQLLQTLRTGSDSLDAALEREAHCQSENYASPEFAEGVRAAIEKRAAEFK